MMKRLVISLAVLSSCAGVPAHADRPKPPANRGNTGCSAVILEDGSLEATFSFIVSQTEGKQAEYVVSQIVEGKPVHVTRKRDYKVTALVPQECTVKIPGEGYGVAREGKQLDAAAARDALKQKTEVVVALGLSPDRIDARPLKPGTIVVGVVAANVDVAKTLAEAEAVSLPDGLIAIDEAAARSIVEVEGKNLILRGVTSFDSPDSVAVARTLATREGSLALPNLKRISPLTLAALLQKNDVEIPLVETLELIPEPDGSPTDDLVIPPEIQQRLRSQQQ